jgi:hypothetical protein
VNGLALLLLLLLGLVGPAHAAPDVGLYDAIGRPIALPAVKLPGGGADHLIAVCSCPARSATPSPHSTSASTTPSSPRGGHVDLVQLWSL